MLLDGEIEGVEARLLDAERDWIDHRHPRGPQVPAAGEAFVDNEELRRSRATSSCIAPAQA